MPRYEIARLQNIEEMPAARVCWGAPTKRWLTCVARWS
jgi:hypothetical protein